MVAASNNELDLINQTVGGRVDTKRGRSTAMATGRPAHPAALQGRAHFSAFFSLAAGTRRCHPPPHAVSVPGFVSAVRACVSTVAHCVAFPRR